MVLSPVSKETIIDLLPPQIQQSVDEFHRCLGVWTDLLEGRTMDAKFIKGVLILNSIHDRHQGCCLCMAAQTVTRINNSGCTIQQRMEDVMKVERGRRE